MIIEFKPGLILEDILTKKLLILKNMPQVKAIFLGRFNELFTGKHNLTLVEDIPGTFTTNNEKEFRNFNVNFRVIATCKDGEESKWKLFFLDFHLLQNNIKKKKKLY